MALSYGRPAQWGNFSLELIDQHSVTKGMLYWFLTSKGFRTNHYLSLYFWRHFPCAGVDTPDKERSIIDAFRANEDSSFAPVG